MVPQGIILALTCPDGPWPISQQLLDIPTAHFCGYYLRMRQKLRGGEPLVQAHTARKHPKWVSVASSETPGPRHTLPHCPQEFLSADAP